MASTRTSTQYATFKRPSWAPPSWVFGPVWTVLYILIALSYGYTAYLFVEGSIPFIISLPFILNLIFNFSYIYIQFRFHNFVLAAVDVLLVLATLVWAIIAIYPVSHIVAYSNIPYLLWVSFASVLQLTITGMNVRGE